MSDKVSAEQQARDLLAQMCDSEDWHDPQSMTGCDVMPLANLIARESSVRRAFIAAIDCVDQIFQVSRENERPILPDFCQLGESKFEACVKLAKEYKRLMVSEERQRIKAQQLTSQVEYLHRLNHDKREQLEAYRRAASEGTCGDYWLVFDLYKAPACECYVKRPEESEVSDG